MQSHGLSEPSMAAAHQVGSRRRERIVQQLFLLPAIAYILIFFGYPVVKNVVMGFQDYSMKSFFTGKAPWVGLQNYETVVASPIFSTALVNTIVFTIGSIAGQFVIGLAIALYFRRRFPLNDLLRSLILLPWLLPLIVSSAIWRWLLDQDNGALNRILDLLQLADRPGWLTTTSLALVACILVNIWVGIPFNVAILYSGLQEIPEELYEAAQMDGANRFKRLIYITLPALANTIITVFILNLAKVMNLFESVFVTQSAGTYDVSQVLQTYIYNKTFSASFSDYGYTTAVGLFKSFVGMILVLGCNYASKKVRGRGIV